MKENMLMVNGMEKENKMRMKKKVMNHNYYMKENLKMVNGMEKEKNMKPVCMEEDWNMKEILLMVNILKN